MNPVDIAIVQMYTEEKLSGLAIAQRLGVGRQVVYGCLNRLDIPKRSSREANQLAWLQGRTRHTPSSAVKNCSDDQIKESLVDLYIRQGLSVWATGNKIGVNGVTVANWLKQYSIPARSKTENAQRLISQGKFGARKGSQNHRWKGGTIRDGGYIYRLTPDHHRKTKRGHYIQEHILVWEETHKQPLPEGWIVHHINGIRDDNRPVNLHAMQKSDHKSWTLVSIYQQRIRELEHEIALLKETK